MDTDAAMDVDVAPAKPEAQPKEAQGRPELPWVRRQICWVDRRRPRSIIARKSAISGKCHVRNSFNTGSPHRCM